MNTPLHDLHVALGAKMVDFAGWEMPIQYPGGIVEEHLRTRREAGLFDVSHMGRFRVRGAEAAALLDRVLTNEASSLRTGRAQYTLFPTATGGAVDDAFLYRLADEDFLLVVNASNRERDWERLSEEAKRFRRATAQDQTFELAMVSLQGPRSRDVLESARRGALEETVRSSPRNTIWTISLAGMELLAARTGYAGEPQGFELLVPAGKAGEVWDLLSRSGAVPVGLGARDTLRLEAGLPLYGHELGTDPEGKEIPIYSCPQARGCVSFASHKSSLPGHASLERQAAAWKVIREANAAGGAGGVTSSAKGELPRLLRQMTLLEPGVARSGARVMDAGGSRQLGWVTSGTVVPCWIFEGEGSAARITDRSDKRSALLALVDSAARVGDRVKIEVRGKLLDALIVPRLLDSSVPPFVRPVPYRA